MGVGEMNNQTYESLKDLQNVDLDWDKLSTPGSGYLDLGRADDIYFTSGSRTNRSTTESPFRVTPVREEEVELPSAISDEPGEKNETDIKGSVNLLLNQFQTVIDSIEASGGPAQAVNQAGFGFVKMYGFAELLAAINISGESKT